MRKTTPTTGRGEDWSRFLAAWMRNPGKMGAIAPSSPSYAAMMVSHASVAVEGAILELGPGLGVVTRALLDAGVAPGRITAIEFDPDFAGTLRRRFPGVDVVTGDGFDLDRTLAARRGETFAAILFAIPILHLPQARRQALFAGYFERLRPGGNLTQLSYMPVPPVRGLPGVFTVQGSRRVWDNIPPARVWVYSRDETGAPGAAR